MKRLLALSFALLIAVSTLGFAINAEVPGESASGNVVIDVVNSIEHTYSADIVFNPGSFTFNSRSVWDDEKFNYELTDGGAWSNTPGSLTVTNRSDMDVEYVVSISGVVETYGELDIFFIDGEGASLGAANITGSIPAVLPNADAGVELELAKWNVSGTPNVATLENQVLGTITVTLTAVVPNP